MIDEPSVARSVARYLELVDERLPGRIEGLYLIGSAALDDFHPAASDIDFVAVTATPTNGEEIDALRGVHERHTAEHRKPWFSGIYVTWRDLASDPRHLTRGPSHHEGHFDENVGFDANPVQWRVLATRPIAFRGSLQPEVLTDDTAVRDWTKENLNAYWAKSLVAQRKRPSRAVIGASDWGIAWHVLGVARMHYTLTTGDVTSKAGAGDYAMATFDIRWHPIVREALRIRREQPRRGRLAFDLLSRWRASLAFMAFAIDDANARWPSNSSN